MNLLNKIQLLFKNYELQRTVIVTVGMFIGSVFAYLLQILLGRLLSVSDYGIFNSLLSVFSIISVISSAFITSLIKVVSELKVNNKFDLLTALFVKVTIAVVVIGFFVFLPITVFRESIATFLNISNLYLVSVFGLFVGITFLGIVPASYLQGLLRLKAFSFWTVLSNFLRFAVPTAFVYIGFSVTGVFTGLIIAAILSFLIGLLLLMKNFSSYENPDLKNQYSKLFTFVWLALFINIGMSIFNNVDVVLVKHYFDAHLAGIYSGVVTIGKVFLFGASTVGVVMYPQIASAFARKEDFVAKFRTYFLIQLSVVLVGLTVFVIFPDFITRVMFGQDFLPSAAYLVKYSVFVAAYVMLNFMTMFFLAIEQKKILFFQIPAVLLQLVLLTVFHTSLDQVINVNIGVSLLLLIFIMLYYARYVGINNNAGVSA
ncbi:oligosaccharide flippase family protein [candidate division WWE3 bacterium]|nr:oligosaccharide flippase family protein [candidate division WWE3 bacterium]